MENVKDWLDNKGYYNSGLRTDRNHRIDLYLSDVLDEYRTELLGIHNVVERSEQLKDLKEPTFEEWLKDNFIPLGNNGFTNRNEDTVWTKSELAEIHATLHL